MRYLVTTEALISGIRATTSTGPLLDRPSMTSWTPEHQPAWTSALDADYSVADSRWQPTRDPPLRPVIGRLFRRSWSANNCDSGYAWPLQSGRRGRVPRVRPRSAAGVHVRPRRVRGPDLGQAQLPAGQHLEPGAGGEPDGLPAVLAEPGPAGLGVFGLPATEAEMFRYAAFRSAGACWSTAADMSPGRARSGWPWPWPRSAAPAGAPLPVQRQHIEHRNRPS